MVYQEAGSTSSLSPRGVGPEAGGGIGEQDSFFSVDAWDDDSVSGSEVSSRVAPAGGVSQQACLCHSCHNEMFLQLHRSQQMSQDRCSWCAAGVQQVLFVA